MGDGGQGSVIGAYNTASSQYDQLTSTERNKITGDKTLDETSRQELLTQLDSGKSQLWQAHSSNVNTYYDIINDVQNKVKAQYDVAISDDPLYATRRNYSALVNQKKDMPGADQTILTKGMTTAYGAGAGASLLTRGRS